MKINFKERKGITLIALVITIIVLLILAAVSIAMLTGENGILKKSSTAKEKTIKAQYEEELNLCILEMQTDELGNLNMSKIKEKLPTYIQDSQKTGDYEWDTNQSEEEPKGVYKGYDFYIDKSYKAHIGELATGITITCVTDPIGYTNQNVDATIKIKSNNGLKSITPTGETTIALSGEKEYTITKTGIETNTTFTYEIEDMQGNKESKTAQITNIDKLNPTTCTITVEITETGIKITETAEDADETTENAKSGIGHYEYYVTGSNGTTTPYTTNTIDLATGTYSIYAIAYDKAGNPKQSNTVENVKVSKVYTNITAQMVADYPEKYYGLSVTNYTSQNGQNDWKIFYSNGTNIFLITGDYVDLSKDGMINANTKIQINDSNKYMANWSGSDIPEFKEPSDETKELFIACEYYSLNKDKINSKCVSTLLNPEYWTQYKDTTKALSAIGGSTLEMYIKSWNTRYPSDIIYYKYTNENGYLVSLKDEKPSNSWTEASDMKKLEGYNNSLYYINKDKHIDIDRYRLAACNGYDDTTTCTVEQEGRINGYGQYNSYKQGLRPIVALKENTTVNAMEAE